MREAYMSASPMPAGTGETPMRAIVLLAFAGFVSAANLRVCDPLLPQIAGELGVTIGGAGAVVTAFALSYGLFQVVIGPLGDAQGKLRVIVLGCLWAGAATVACAMAGGLASLTLLRFLAGIGGAAIIPLAIAWLGDVIPYDRRQPILARFASGQILGVVFGQAAGGILGELVGWRGAMLLLGAVHLCAGAMLALETRRLSAGVPAPGRAQWRNAGSAAIDILRRPWAQILLGTTFLEGVLMFGAFAYVGAHLHQRFGVGPGLVGLTIAAFGIGALIYALSAGALVERLGQPKLLALGSSLLAVGYVLLAVTPWLWPAVPAVAIVGLGFYMLHNTLQTEATQLAPEARGLAVSLFAIMLFTGQSVGVALAGLLLDRWGGAPVFLAAAAGMLAIILWFRVQLLRRKG
jgi:MFS transporter, YNFM family, putative membrane transport protein